jgi:hypothetical protein
LLLEGEAVQKDFLFKEQIFQGLGGRGRGIKEATVFMEDIAHGLDLFDFIGLSKTGIAFGIESANGGEEFLTVFFGEFGAE